MQTTTSCCQGTYYKKDTKSLRYYVIGNNLLSQIYTIFST